MHPVFDSLNYPWHLAEAHNLYIVLCQAYQNTNDIDTYYKSCGAYVTEIPTINPAQPSGDLWKEVLNKLATKNKIKKLTEVLLQDNPVQQVLDVIQMVQNAVSAVDASIININLVILDRADLRRNLELLATENDPVKVLLIKGGPKSGKSYSRHLFELMAQQQGAEVVYLYRFVVAALSEVLEELFTAAGDVNAIPEGDTTQSGWYGKVCRRLRDTAVAKNKHIWIAMDDLGFIEEATTPGEARKINSIMDPEIRDFFDQFVAQMSGLAFRKHFKLMLINYPSGKLPTSWYQEHLKEEVLQETDIMETHIEDQIQRWCHANKKHVLPGEVKKSAADVITKANNPAPEDNDKPRLERIKDATSHVLKTL
jgi:hypothetical protein